MSDTLPFENGLKTWVIVTKYDSLTFYFTEDSARDNLRRTDRLFSFVVSEFKPETPEG